MTDTSSITETTPPATKREPLLHWGCDIQDPPILFCGEVTNRDRIAEDEPRSPDCVVCDDLVKIPGFCPRYKKCICR